MAIFNNIFGIAIGHGCMVRGFYFGQARNFFLNQYCADDPLNPLYFPWGKAAGGASNLSPAGSVRVKNKWSYTSDLPLRFNDVVNDNFNFYLSFTYKQ